MTSVLAGFSQIPANKLWTNLSDIRSTIVDSNNNPVPWVVASQAQYYLSTPGAAVLRDMGRNVYLPNPTVASAVGSQSTILRRVQLVTSGQNVLGAAGYYGTGNSALSGAGSDTDYYCGYIRLGGQTYAGGGSGFTAVARIN
jgi:hypothetical protein